MTDHLTEALDLIERHALESRAAGSPFHLALTPRQARAFAAAYPDGYLVTIESTYP